MYLSSFGVHVYTYPDLLWVLLQRSRPASFPTWYTTTFVPVPFVALPPPPVPYQPYAPHKPHKWPKPVKPPRPSQTVTVKQEVNINIYSEGGTVNINMPPQPEVVETNAPRLFALVVGINQYRSSSVRNLQGAVPDADNINHYLTEELRVPPSQIRNLRDGEATRAAIIDGIRALTDDPKINSNDPIFIYFAGHGATTKTPDGWEAGGPKIQMLIPHDHDCVVAGKTIYGIPDRTIGVLLERLAKKKGNNVSVIFDCCHSGSGTRTDEIDSSYLVRGIEIKKPVPSDLDKEIWSQSADDRATVVAAGFLQSGLRSHVLLAACGSEETAQEREGRGVFTKSFLETIISTGADKLTYRDIIQRIPNLPALPLGSHHVRREGLEPGRVLHKVRLHDNQYVMAAGEAHGITDGAEFAIYKDRDFTSSTTPLGTLVARETAAFSSILDMPAGSVRIALADDDTVFALQTRAGVAEDLRVHVAMDDRLTAVFERIAEDMQRTDAGQRKVLLVEKDRAEVDIDLEGDRVVFNILDSLATQYGLHRMPYTVRPDADAVYPVITAAAHYYWHLRRTSEKKILQNKVKLEFMKVELSEDEYDDDLNPVVKPAGPDMNKANVVEIFVGDDAMYGMRIVNTTGRDLYPSLFFFDNSDFSITPYYLPATAGQIVDAPLRAKQSLTVGFGAGGSVPYSYFLRDGQDVDVGFLKLFLSTEQVDLAHLVQRSPFEEGRGAQEAPKRSTPIWDTILVSVVQRRGKSPK
ncbi:hypothetical protein EVG20_g6557 [Dentipellis fragilis]|uniref:Peptidase C14 caspase domain-containing protein n=1 Tax=Dentipellis fragilis TaxID=205917 RepID=A0A4Y9YMW6_9AGAM|nr:hypothetical protein EVG20_g6557 [Dentipellis fragilis]